MATVFLRLLALDDKPDALAHLSIEPGPAWARKREVSRSFPFVFRWDLTPVSPARL